MEQQTKTPTEYYKILIMRVLDKSIQKDLEGDKEGYFNGIKNLAKLLKPYIPLKAIEKIEEEYKFLNETIKKIKESKANEKYKEAEILRLKYEFSNFILNYIIEALAHSRILEKEVEGYLFYNEKELNTLASMVRSGKIKASRVVAGELEDGTSERIS